MKSSVAIKSQVLKINSRCSSSGIGFKTCWRILHLWLKFRVWGSGLGGLGWKAAAPGRQERGPKESCVDRRTYIYICIHTYIHIHIRIYIYVYTHTYVYTYIYTYIHMYVYIIKYAYTYVYGVPLTCLPFFCSLLCMQVPMQQSYACLGYLLHLQTLQKPLFFSLHPPKHDRTQSVP